MSLEQDIFDVVLHYEAALKERLASRVEEDDDISKAETQMLQKLDDRKARELEKLDDERDRIQEEVTRLDNELQLLSKALTDIEERAAKVHQNANIEKTMEIGAFQDQMETLMQERAGEDLIHRSAFHQALEDLFAERYHKKRRLGSPSQNHSPLVSMKRDSNV